MTARIVTAMRAASLLGMILGFLAHAVDGETIDAMTGDGCGQILFYDEILRLRRWAMLGDLCPLIIAALSFALPRRSLWHLPALLLWTTLSLYFMRQYDRHQEGIYGCDIFGVPSDLASFLASARPALCLVLIVLAFLLPKVRPAQSP